MIVFQSIFNGYMVSTNQKQDRVLCNFFESLIIRQCSQLRKLWQIGRKTMHMKIKKEKQIIKLSLGCITKIIDHPSDSNSVVILTSSGNISIVQLIPFKQVSTYKISHQYSTCLIAFGQGFCVGNSVGQLTYVNFLGNVLKKLKLFEDCLSSLSKCDSHLVATSFDGTIMFINKFDFNIQHKIDLGVPIWNSLRFENKIYAAGNPSFSINCHTYEVQKLKRFDSFAVFNNKLYANSDQRGLTCLKNNSNSYIPCSFMLPLKERMMIFSEECATEINHEHQMEWKCHRIKSISKGTIITSGCALQNLMILGDNQGSVYKLEYEMVGYTPRPDATSSSDQCS